MGRTNAKQAEYNINVHLNASRTVKHSETGPRYQYVDAPIDGKNYELESVLGAREPLMLGIVRRDW